MTTLWKPLIVATAAGLLLWAGLASWGAEPMVGPAPCCPPGGQCPPNVTNYGYFLTRWSAWPGEQRMDKINPAAINREVVPTPAPAPFAPLREPAPYSPTPTTTPNAKPRTMRPELVPPPANPYRDVEVPAEQSPPMKPRPETPGLSPRPEPPAERPAPPRAEPAPGIPTDPTGLTPAPGSRAATSPIAPAERAIPGGLASRLQSAAANVDTAIPMRDTRSMGQAVIEETDQGPSPTAAEPSATPQASPIGTSTVFSSRELSTAGSPIESALPAAVVAEATGTVGQALAVEPQPAAMPAAVAPEAPGAVEQAFAIGPQTAVVPAAVAPEAPGAVGQAFVSEPQPAGMPEPVVGVSATAEPEPLPPDPPRPAPINQVAHQALTELQAQPDAQPQVYEQPADQTTATVQGAWQPEDAAPAMEGFCPVQLGKNEQWVKGDPRWAVPYQGRTYWLSSAVERECFLVDPEHYVPACGGQDAVLLADEGRSVPGTCDYCVTYGGRLYMFSSAATLARFRQNATHYLAGAHP